MPQRLQQFGVRVARRVNRLLRRAGFEVVRLAPPAKGSPSIFVPPGSCQIGELAALYHQTFGDRRDGHVVEVGAFDGASYSNSSCVIAVGWAALLIEPVPAFAAACRARYVGNPRVTVAEVAIGAEEAVLQLAVAGAMTTGDPDQLAEYATVQWVAPTLGAQQTVSVPSRPLDSVLADHGVVPGFELLIVDVEGMEAQVLAGFDIGRWRPEMMIWELTDTHPDLSVRRADSLRVAAAIVGHGYRVVYKDSINTVFVRN